jgi:hypothetical protein
MFATRIASCLVLIATLLTSSLAAQDATGAIRGTVLDSTGGRIAQASIVIVSVATGLRFTATSDAEGNFALQLLQPGDYSARVVAQGMSPQVTPQLHVDVGAATELSFRLTIAGAHENVTVSGARGSYLRFSYTYARAIDDGQDALVAGQPATVQNSYVPSAERGPSVTDQRHRLVAAFSAEPHFFHRGHEVPGHIFNDWRISTVVNYGSGRPFNATVSGDPNQDSNDLNDRLPGYSRNAFTGPDYATTDLRVTRSLRFGERYKLNFLAESFNLFNRDNQAGRYHLQRHGRLRHHFRAKLCDRQHRPLSRLLPTPK